MTDSTKRTFSEIQTGRDFMAEGGEMGALMRSYNWNASVLGTPEYWPQSLKTSISIMLRSCYPMFIWWGPELIMFHNDAYLPVLGKKHPKALGSRAKDTWAELWQQINPMVDSVFNKGIPVFNQDLLMLLMRKGYPEETYFTFSYSPIVDDDGKIGGMFCACNEETQKIYRQRRLKTLNDISGLTSKVISVNEVCKTVLRILKENEKDVPYSAIYLLDDEGQRASCVGSIGYEDDSDHLFYHIDLFSPVNGDLPFKEVMESLKPLIVENPLSVFRGAHGVDFQASSHRSIILPVMKSGQEIITGFLVCGISNNKEFDEEYNSYFHLIAGQLSTAIANVVAFEEEFKRAEALAEIDKAKTIFFNNISHEFRTPLTLMLGPLEEMLSLHSSDERTFMQLTLVHQNSLRLLQLVNTLLDFSRLEAGRMQATYIPHNLSELTIELCSHFKTAIEKGNLGFEIDCPELSEDIFVDPSLWENIIFNLLSNALKFTFEGKISVGIKEYESTVQVSVEDTGIGIDKSEIHKIFSRFYRVDKRRGRTHEGTGLGLTMVRELVHLHNGDIHVASLPGVGSRFTITLKKGKNHLPKDQISYSDVNQPLHIGENPHIFNYVDEDLSSLTGDKSDLKIELKKEDPGGRDSILVVDDNADMRNYLYRLLSREYHVILAGDGADAYEKAVKFLPKLVLTDVMMPNVDGFELLKMLRLDRATISMPVIFLSARAGEESKLEGLSEGADDYLVKPFSALELKVRVKNHIELVNLREAVNRRELQMTRKLNKRKDEFIGIASHELKTPLTSLKGYLQFLIDNLEEYDVATLRGYLKKADNYAERLNHLITDLLDVSRIRSGKFQFNFKRFDLRELLEEIIEDASNVSRHYEISLTGGNSPIFVHGDRERLEQVVSNLLSNAIKYSPYSNKIFVDVSANEKEVLVSVKDFGIGIPADQLKGIFNRYGRVKSELNISGLGLGLFISADIINRHSGKIWAESKLGEGSVFHFTLPLHTKATASKM